MGHLGRLDGSLDVVVEGVHYFAGGGAGAVPPELLELETLAVLPSDVH